MTESPPAKTSILLTGSTGFLGGHLVKYFLEQGFRVGAITRPDLASATVLPPAVERITFATDVDEDALFEGFADATLIHCAAFTTREDTFAGISHEVESNISYSIRVFEACRLSGMRNFINVGSFWEHSESGALAPINSYAAMKTAFQTYLDFMAARYGVNVATLKLSETYADDDTRPKVIPLIFKAAFSGATLKMSDGHQQTSFTHISDVVRAFAATEHYLKSADANARHSVFHVNSGVSTSIRDLAKTISDVTGPPKKPDIIWGAIPPRANGLWKAWIDGQTPPDWAPEIELQAGLKLVMKKQRERQTKDAPLSDIMVDKSLTLRERKNIIRSRKDELENTDPQSLVDFLIKLIRRGRGKGAIGLMKMPEVQRLIQNSIGQIVRLYPRYLQDQEDMDAMRAICVDHLINYTNLNYIARQIFKPLLKQGWLDELKFYFSKALKDNSVSRDNLCKAYFADCLHLIDDMASEAPLSRINLHLRELLGHFIEHEKCVLFKYAVNQLVTMHYAESNRETTQIMALIQKIVAQLGSENTADGLTLEANFDSQIARSLLGQDREFIDRIRAKVADLPFPQVTLVFCSFPYIKYFEVFYAQNKRFLGKVVVISLDVDAKDWFDEKKEEFIHINHSIYNGTLDFKNYLWRKRFEAVHAILQSGKNVFLCGIDSLFYKDVIQNFESSPFDIIAGEGPGLPMSAVKSHISLNCDLLFIRSTENVNRIFRDVLDYSGVYLTDQSALNIICARNGATLESGSHETVEYEHYKSKHGVAVACAKGNFMVRSRTIYDAQKEMGHMWVFQPHDKEEILSVGADG